ncbi:hypothetical protein [Streptomyces sp. NBC_01669]|uniref:hypothetical protein n=1 Tax=Streptomyces sp. NBC_01669 TaxID=2975909 RepID=UPI00225330D1|nr:hypothetical protein [Streptomyces sp. NBC_01669]MCX4538417.1 hypothetical protein [Streptomyces sp. NBC_01669]
MVDVALAAVDVTACVFVMNGGGGFHGRHLLAEARRHLALVLRGRRRERGLDERIVDAALAAYCTDITDARTSRGQRPEYRLYTARWALPGAAPARRPPTDVPEPDRNPPADPGDPAAPRLPREARQWDIPRVPLRYDRAVIAGAVLTAQLRTARSTGRDPYDVAFHQQAAMPEQLNLLAQEDRPVRKARRAVDLDALRTDIAALELTADQLLRFERAGTKLNAEVRERMHQAPGLPDETAPRPHCEDDQCAHRPHQPGPGQSSGAPR